MRLLTTCVVLLMSLPVSVSVSANDYFSRPLWQMRPDPTTPITLYIIDEARLRAYVTQWQMPHNTGSIAVRHDKGCTVYITPRAFHSDLLAHEVRHCQEGQYHEW